MPISLARLSEKLEDRVGQVQSYAAEAMRRKVSSVGREVITQSPIDTGRFVGSWRTKIGSPELSSPSRTGLSNRGYNRIKRSRRPPYRRTPEAIANAQAEEKASIEELDQVVAKMRDERPVYITNNARYAMVLENRGNRHGPRIRKPGFIRRAIERGSKKRQGRLRKNVFTR